MSFFTRLFGDKRVHGSTGQNQPVESGRCGICSGSQSPACAFPYSKEEEARFVHIGTVFYQGVAPEDAIQQLVKEKGWDDQSTRNCVNLTYARIGQIEDEK